MKYLTRFLNQYDKPSLLLFLKSIRERYSFIVLGNSALTLHCGFPTNSIDIILIGEGNEQKIEGINVINYGQRFDEFILTPEYIEVTTLGSFNVLTEKAIFDTVNQDLSDYTKYSHLIQERHLPRKFLGSIKSQKGRLAFIEAYEKVYGFQGKTDWSKYEECKRYDH